MCDIAFDYYPFRLFSAMDIEANELITLPKNIKEEEKNRCKKRKLLCKY